MKLFKPSHTHKTKERMLKAFDEGRLAYTTEPTTLAERQIAVDLLVGVGWFILGVLFFNATSPQQQCQSIFQNNRGTDDWRLLDILHNCHVAELPGAQVFRVTVTLLVLAALNLIRVGLSPTDTENKRKITALRNILEHYFVEGDTHYQTAQELVANLTSGKRPRILGLTWSLLREHLERDEPYRCHHAPDLEINASAVYR